MIGGYFFVVGWGVEKIGLLIWVWVNVWGVFCRFGRDFVWLWWWLLEWCCGLCYGVESVVFFFLDDVMWVVMMEMDWWWYFGDGVSDLVVWVFWGGDFRCFYGILRYCFLFNWVGWLLLYNDSFWFWCKFVKLGGS